MEETPKQSTPQEESNIHSFFTKEINTSISEMSVKEMDSILKGMITTREFIAILKYNTLRTPLLDNSLRNINPVVDPHKISWCQGALNGLSDIVNYIIEISSEKKIDTEENKEEINRGPEGFI